MTHTHHNGYTIVVGTSGINFAYVAEVRLAQNVIAESKPVPTPEAAEEAGREIADWHAARPGWGVTDRRNRPALLA